MCAKPTSGAQNIFYRVESSSAGLLPMNRHMTTAYSNEIDSQNLKIRIRDPGSGSGIRIRDPDPVFFKTGIRIRIRSETDRIRNTGKD